MKKPYYAEIQYFVLVEAHMIGKNLNSTLWRLKYSFKRKIFHWSFSHFSALGGIWRRGLLGKKGGKVIEGARENCWEKTKKY